jgi:uncharacterized protein YdeI (YjbR/CyaY-like superfamily)
MIEQRNDETQVFSDWHAWLEEHHEMRNFGSASKRSAPANPGITWPEAVDEELCFGWIDGVRKSLGEVPLHFRDGEA